LAGGALFSGHLENLDAGETAGLAMLGVAGALAIYDIIDAGFAARRANRRRVIKVAPVIGRSRDQAFYGLGLSGVF
jgi:hypothetical protein